MRTEHSLKSLELRDFFKKDISFGDLIREAYSIASMKVIDLHSNNQYLDDMILEKWKPKQYGLDELMMMPDNSLGRSTAIYLFDVTKDQEFIHKFPSSIRFPINYPIPKHKLIPTRVKQTHDYIHILTNIDTSQIGELVIQGFYLGQRTSYLGLVCIVKSLVDYFINKGDSLLLEAIIEGLNMGLKADKDCVFYRFEDDIKSSIDQLRSKLNIERSENKPWSYKY